MTVARAGPACLSAFVSASCTIRYADTSMLGRQLDRLALDVHLDRKSRGGDLRREIVEPPEARLRGERGAFVGGPQHAEQPAHLRRAPARPRARSRRARHASRRGRRSSMRRPPRACRTITLIACATTSCSSRAIRARSSAIASAVRVSCSIDQHALALGAVAEQPAGDERRPEEDEEERDIGEADGLARLDRRQRNRGRRRSARCGDQRPAARPPAGRVERDDERRPGRSPPPPAP